HPAVAALIEGRRRQIEWPGLGHLDALPVVLAVHCRSHETFGHRLLPCWALPTRMLSDLAIRSCVCAKPISSSSIRFSVDTISAACSSVMRQALPRPAVLSPPPFGGRENSKPLTC